VTVIRLDDAPDPDPNVIELVDNGSVLAKTIIADLGARVRRHRPAPRPAPRPRPATEPPRVVADAPRPKPMKPIKHDPPAPPHPLRELVGELRSRLGQLNIGGYRWVIVERAEPMFGF